MELKLLSGKESFKLSRPLIVPYGIETASTTPTTNADKAPLIVPYGIETPESASTTFAKPFL